jgi:hypothetical protein
LAVLDADQLPPCRGRPSRLRNGDCGDADRRQGLLPFHRLGQAARNSRCRASGNTTSINQCHWHRHLIHHSIARSHPRAPYGVRDAPRFQTAYTPLLKPAQAETVRSAPRTSPSCNRPRYSQLATRRHHLGYCTLEPLHGWHSSLKYVRHASTIASGSYGLAMNRLFATARSARSASPDV